MKGFEVSFARRLAWKTQGRRRVSPAVGVAVGGVALSVLVMLISIAVVLGFKGEIASRILAADDAVTISSPEPFDPAEILSVINLPAHAQTVGHTSIPAILKTPDDFLGLELQSSPNVADTAIVLSRKSAARLRLSPGDHTPAYFFVNDRLRVRSLTVDTTYTTGFDEHDAAVGYCSAALVGQLLDIPDGRVFSLGIRNIPRDEIEPLADAVYSSVLRAHYCGEIHGSYAIQTALQTNGQMFAWLQLLDTNVVVILLLMSLVAAFTLISSLFIIILERVQTIGLLKALGATNGQIRRIFMLLAERLVLRGLLWGNLVGLLIIAIQTKTHIIPLDSANYYVDFVPVTFSPAAILLLNLGVILLSWLILMIPAALIARISPAATMRYD